MCGWHEPRVHWNDSTYCARKWQHSPYPCPSLDHIRMGMTAGHLSRLQSPQGVDIGLGGVHSAHVPWVSFSACFLLPFPMLLVRAPNHGLWAQGDARPAVPVIRVPVSSQPRGTLVDSLDFCRGLSFSAVQLLF